MTWPVPQYRGVNLGGWLVLESWVSGLRIIDMGICVWMDVCLDPSPQHSALTFIMHTQPHMHTTQKPNTQMYPEWWRTTGVPFWKGEHQFVETLGKAKARALLEKHWDTWVRSRHCVGDRVCVNPEGVDACVCCVIGGLGIRAPHPPPPHTCLVYRQQRV